MDDWSRGERHNSKSNPMKTLSIITLAVLLLGCGKSAQETVQTSNGDFRVGLLFEADGVKVYRFSDAGAYRYYAVSKSGSTHTSWEIKHDNGKTTYTSQHEMPFVSRGSLLAMQASLLGQQADPPGHREYLASLKPAPLNSRIVLDPRGCEYVLLYQPGNSVGNFTHMPTCRNWRKHNPDYHGRDGYLYSESGTP